MQPHTYTAEAGAFPPVLRALRARSPAPAASTLLFDGEGRVLLVRRGSSPYRGYWSLPGGHIEHGEDSLTAAIRETVEETGIRPEIVGLAAIAELIGVERHYLILVYWGRGGGSPTPATDALEATWVSPEKALRLNLTPSTRALLENWRPGLLLGIVCRLGSCRAERLGWANPPAI